MLKSPIVLDCGSFSTRSGFAYTDQPSVEFPTVLEPREDENQVTLKYPIRRGIIEDIDCMEYIFRHAFDELKVTPNEHPLLLADAVGGSKSTRHRLVQIIFETFQVPSLHLALHQVLSLFASGRTTGLVCDSGETTRTVPIYEGHALKSCVFPPTLGGSDLYCYFNDFLHEKFTFDRKTVCDIKEKLSFVSLDYRNEKSNASAEYKLPDGNLLKLGKERYLYPETMFNPGLRGLVTFGIDEHVCNTGMKCDANIRGELFKNILLCGGNSLLNGFPQRLEKEVRSNYDKGPIKLVTARDRKCSAWLGGSILASLPTFSNLCIKIEEYNDYGPSYVDTKFF